MSSIIQSILKKFDVNFEDMFQDWDISPDPLSTQESASNLDSLLSQEPALEKLQESELIRKGEELRFDPSLFNILFLHLKENLKSETKGRAFIRSLSMGNFDIPKFKQHLKDLESIHFALETAEKKIEPTPFFHVVIPSLWRSDQLKADLAAWGVDNQSPSKAALNYSRYLETLADAQPGMLPAHLFVVYGGLLFCGETVRKQVERTFRSFFPSNEKGCNHYFTFEKHQELKAEWVQRYNELITKSDFSERDVLFYQKQLKDEIMLGFGLFTEVIEAMDYHLASGGMEQRMASGLPPD